MMTFNLLGHAIDHGNHPHLCVELTDAEFEEYQATFDRAREIFGGDLGSVVRQAMRLLQHEITITEESLRKLGRKVG